MTKTRLVSALAALALVAVPGAAYAHRGDSQHHKRHAKRHHAHARKARIREVVGSSSTTAPSSTAPAASTATITSFDPPSGDLTITLPNGKSYTATVTKRTHLECTAAAVPVPRSGKDDGDDDNNNDTDDHTASTTTPSSTQSAARGDDEGDDDDNEQDDNDDESGTVPTACDTSALTPKTQVTEADLSIGSAGAVWKKLELVK